MESTFLARDDRELARLLEGYLSDELTISCGSRVIRVETTNDSKRVFYTKDGAELSIDCDEILVAVGRKPNIDSLQLEAAGVETNRRGIIVDQYTQTSAAGIYACGDCAGGPQFTHYAEAQARAAIRNALFVGKKAFAPTIPWATFTDPEMAHVGLTEAEASEEGVDVAVYRYGYDRLDRAVCEGRPRGLAKVVCDGRGKILGASILGVSAGDAINEPTLAMNLGVSLSEISRSIHVYPTMTRIVRRLGDQRFFDEGVSKLVKTLFGRFDGDQGPAR